MCWPGARVVVVVVVAVRGLFYKVEWWSPEKVETGKAKNSHLQGFRYPNMGPNEIKHLGDIIKVDEKDPDC